MTKTGRIWFLGLFFFLGVSGHLFAEDTDAPTSTQPDVATTTPPAPPVVEEWNTGLQPRSSFWTRSSERMADIIYDLIEDISFDQGIGKFTLNLASRRIVFDNRDVLNSWSVMDRFTVGGVYPIFSTNFGVVDFNIGARAGVDIVNIRQVLPRDYSALPSVDQAKTEMEEADWYKDFKENRGKTPAVQVQTNTNEKKETIFSAFVGTPENNARFSKQLNRLTHPFRLPLSKKSFDKLSNGEIMSYTTSLGGSVGASVGWEVDPFGVAGRVAVGVGTFLNGDARVTVLKEDQRYAKVKRSLIGTFGGGPAVSSETDITAVDGMIVVKDIADELKIIPFRLELSKQWSKAFDVGYRYDMENSFGVAAYEAAVLNDFRKSDEYAIDEFGNPRDFAETGVQKVFTRNSSGTVKGVNQRFRLTFAYNRRQSTTLNQVEARVTMPDGTYHLFTSEVQNSRQWKTIWGSFEKFNYNFSATLNLTRYEKEPEAVDSFVLTTDGSIEDSSASYKELMSYILEAENAVGKPGLFPRPPPDMIFRSLKKSASTPVQDLSKTDVGRARIYYQLNFSRPQIEKFINTPNQEMWPIVEKAFDVEVGSWSNPITRRLKEGMGGALFVATFPMYFLGSPLRGSNQVYHAAKIRDRWAGIKNEKSIVHKLNAFGNFMFDRYYSYEIIRILKSKLDGEEVDYLVTGDSPVFGHIWRQGRTQLQFENIATKIQQEIDFDRGDAHVPQLTKETEVEDLWAELMENPLKLKIHFKLNKAPKAIFLQASVHETQSYKPEEIKPLGNVLYANDDTLVEGANSFLLDSTDAKSPFYRLAQQLKRGKKYTFRIAANENGIAWGRTVDLEVRIPAKQ